MTDPQTLLTNAKCYLCLGITLAEALELALLDQTFSAVGSGGLVYTASYADPNAAGLVPFNPAQGALFYQDPSITLYNEWKWSPLGQIWYQTVAPI